MNPTCQVADLLYVGTLQRSLRRLPASLRPRFVALVGSRAAGFNHAQSDLDLLVILNNTDDELPQSPRKCEVVEREIKKLEKPGLLAVACVPSFALLQHSMEMARRNRRGDLLTVHLLVYPTFANLLAWELPSVVVGFLAGLKPQNILVGKKEQIPRLPSSASPDFARDHSSLLNTFQNSYVYFLHLRDVNEDFALQYGLKHLRYCVRHLADAYLRSAGVVHPPEATTWGNILRHVDRLPSSARKLFLELDTIRPEPPRQPTRCCNPNTLLRLYRAGWTFFHDCHPSRKATPSK